MSDSALAEAAIFVQEAIDRWHEACMEVETELKDAGARVVLRPYYKKEKIYRGVWKKKQIIEPLYFELFYKTKPLMGFMHRINPELVEPPSVEDFVAVIRKALYKRATRKDPLEEIKEIIKEALK